MFLSLRKLTVTQASRVQKTNIHRQIPTCRVAPPQKQSEINSLVHRAFTISDKEHLQIELNHLKLTLQKNEHDKKNITKIINKYANKTLIFDTQLDEKILSILPYVKRTTDRINRILNEHNIRTIFKKPPKIGQKIGQILRNSKDQRPPLSSAGVYKIPCSCGQVHIGETERMVNL